MRGHSRPKDGVLLHAYDPRIPRRKAPCAPNRDGRDKPGHDRKTAMTYLAKPKFHHPELPKNALGYTHRDLIYLGVSGDGDSASIGLGQFAHCLRRGVNMVYIVENNGVYGLTKGQFSATADRGSKSKRGMMNTDNSIDLVAMALQLGATFVARSFSGDKTQL